MNGKHQDTICIEGKYYLAVLVFVATGAIVRDINPLIVIAGMMVGPLIYNWRSVARSLRGLDVTRNLPGGVCAGDLLVVDITIENTRKSRDSWTIDVEDQLVHVSRQTGPERATTNMLFERVEAGCQERLSYQGRLHQRGRYQFGPLKVSTRYPLGFVKRTITIGAEQTMVVCPRLGHLAAAWGQLHQEAVVGSRQKRQRQGTSVGEFFAMRDWRQGDSQRWIHWRTSARRGGLVVRQFEEQQEQDLLLLVDLWQPESPSPDHLDAVEMAISFAATVVAELCRQGSSRLDVGLAGAQTKLAGGTASMALLTEAMEDLAIAEPSSHDQLPQLMRRAFQTSSPATTTLVISTRRIDLSDPQFAQIDENLPEGPAARRIVCVDASSETLSEYFEID